MAVAIPITGWAESRWGGKRVWMAALLLFVLGSVLCALSWSDTSLIGFRVLQGFAAGPTCSCKSDTCGAAKEVAIPISAVTGVDDGIQLNITKQQVKDLPPVDIDRASG